MLEALRHAGEYSLDQDAPRAQISDMTTDVTERWQRIEELTTEVIALGETIQREKRTIRVRRRALMDLEEEQDRLHDTANDGSQHTQLREDLTTQLRALEETVNRAFRELKERRREVAYLELKHATVKRELGRLQLPPEVS